MMRCGRSSFPRLPSTRVLGVAAPALLLIGVVLSALGPPVVTAPGQPRTAVVVAPRPRAVSHLPMRTSPISAGRLGDAHAVAASFIDCYLRVTYGRAPATSLTVVTPALRRELVHGRAQLTPAERSRHPRVLSVEAVGQAPGVVRRTVVVSAAGVTWFFTRFTVQAGPGGSFVSDVIGG